MDPEGGVPEEVAQQLEASDKLIVEVDRRKLNGLLDIYKRNLKVNDRTKGVVYGYPADMREVGLIRKFFDVIGQSEQTQEVDRVLSGPGLLKPRRN